MTEDERALESIKLLRESSAWMIGVQTAIFGFLVTLLNAGRLMLGSYLIKGALTAFLLSIVFAGVVLGSVPWIVSRQPMPSSIRSAPIANLPLLGRVPVGLVSGMQYTAFIVGIICLAMALIRRQIG